MRYPTIVDPTQIERCVDCHKTQKCVPFEFSNTRPRCVTAGAQLKLLHRVQKGDVSRVVPLGTVSATHQLTQWLPSDI